MRKLTQREKILVVLVAVVALVVLALQLGPAIRQAVSGGDLAVMREQLQTAQALVELAQTTEQIDEKIRDDVGLQGQFISDSLFDEISSRANLESINRARRVSDFAALLPALEAKADTLLAYKKQHGEFENLEALKEIRGPIFEGGQPEAVISWKISDLAQKAGLKPNYQLNIKPMPGRKSVKLPVQSKRNLVLYLYLRELEGELQQLQAEHRAIEAKQEQKSAEDLAMDALLDAWWGDDEETEIEKGESDAIAPEPDEQLVADQGADASDSADDEAPVEDAALTASTGDSVPTPNRQFVPLPDVIPLTLRIQLIQFIQANLKRQMAGATESKKGFLDDQIILKRTEAQGGFLGIGGREETVLIKLKPNGLLMSKFQELINRYEAEQAYDLPEGEAEDTLDYTEQLRALTQYVDSILQQQGKFERWFAEVPSTYQPETYVVDMNFNAEIDKVVRLIHEIESTSKWLLVKDLRISIADRKKTTLGVNLSMIAHIL